MSTSTLVTPAQDGTSEGEGGWGAWRRALALGPPAFGLFGPAMAVATLLGAVLLTVADVGHGERLGETLARVFVPALTILGVGLLLVFLLGRFVPRRLFHSRSLATAVTATYGIFVVGALAGIWIGGWTWTIVTLGSVTMPRMIPLSYAGTVIAVWLIVAVLTNHLGIMIDSRRRYEAQLRQQLEELTRSRSRVLTVQEDLRQEISVLLHGQVQNRLLLATHYLKQAQKQMDGRADDATQMVAQACSLVEKVNQQELRIIARRLHPSIIRLGLAGALRSLTDGYGGIFMVEMRLHNGLALQGNPGGVEVPERVRLAAYRIAEEALNNAAKHACATKVEVEARVSDDNHLVLMLTDNGKGFDPAKTKSGMGLQTMVDYCGAQGGWLTVSSTPGGGTTVRAELPLGLGREVAQGAATAGAGGGSAGTAQGSALPSG